MHTDRKKAFLFVRAFLYMVPEISRILPLRRMPPRLYHEQSRRHRNDVLWGRSLLTRGWWRRAAEVMIPLRNTKWEYFKYLGQKICRPMFRMGVMIPLRYVYDLFLVTYVNEWRTPGPVVPSLRSGPKSEHVCLPAPARHQRGEPVVNTGVSANHARGLWVTHDPQRSDPAGHRRAVVRARGAGRGHRSSSR